MKYVLHMKKLKKTFINDMPKKEWEEVSLY